MSLPNFTDLGKATRDLLTKNFPGDKSKVEVTSNTPNGATYISSATRDSKGAVVTLFNPKFKHTDYGLNVNASVASDEKLKAEVSIENKLAQGLKTTVVAQKGDQKALSPLKASAEYTTSGFTGNLAFDFAEDYYATASVVGGHEGFVAGLEVQAVINKQNLSGAKGLLGFKNSEFETFATLTRTKETAVQGNVTYYHNVTSNFQVGGELTVELRAAPPKPDPVTAPATAGSTTAVPAAATGTPAPTAPQTPVCALKPTFAFVGNYKLADDATAKFKADQTGVLSLAYYHQLNKNVKLGLGGSLATTDLSGTAHKFGAELLFNF